MKSYESKYIAKLYDLIVSGSAEHEQHILNLMELLGLLISSNKSNASKVFNCNVEVDQQRVNFSQILNLALLHSHESSLDQLMQKSEIVP